MPNIVAHKFIDWEKMFFEDFAKGNLKYKIIKAPKNAEVTNIHITFFDISAL